jgi:pyridoxal phosphate enzyme (YggS family)
VAEWPIQENLTRVQERIARACTRAGRRPEGITLVAVSKTFPAEAIRAAYECGVRHFGENRVQEWEGKQPLLADLDATWHLVGHLQSNKARRAVRLFHRIDSVDSLALAQRLAGAVDELSEQPSTEATEAQRARRQSRKERSASRMPVLIEVRLAPEETKSGVEPEDLPVLVEGVLALPQLELRGLMCIPPLFDDPERARPYFRRLRELGDDLLRRFISNLQPRTSNLHLSMGMSHDFEIAIEEGATEIRLGTALFGKRSAA